MSECGLVWGVSERIYFDRAPKVPACKDECAAGDE